MELRNIRAQLFYQETRLYPPPRCGAKKKEKMKINRPVNERYCYNCRKFEDCKSKGVFDEDPFFNFCVNYEDVSYTDDDNDKND